MHVATLPVVRLIFGTSGDEPEIKIGLNAETDTAGWQTPKNLEKNMPES